jgi:hypothetical protein
MADAKTTVREHIEMSQPPDGVICAIGITNEAANGNQLGLVEDTQQGLAGFRETVAAGDPVIDEAVHEAISFRSSRIG